MATAMPGFNPEYSKIIRKLMEPNFLDDIIKNVSEMFDKMHVIDKFLFSEYAGFIKDVKQFKESLLKFILESKIHLSVLKDNFQKPNYKQVDERRKLQFIKERLDKIHEETLFKYLIACERLIKTSIKLHDKYGTKLFKLKYVALNLLGFTVGGAIAGFTIGLILPFLEPVEIGIGAAAGALIGLAVVPYELIVNWKNHMKNIEVTRKTLKDIQGELERVLAQMRATYEKFGMAKTELQYQYTNNSFQDINDLEQYVLRSFDEFIVLEKVLSKVNTDV